VLYPAMDDGLWSQVRPVLGWDKPVLVRSCCWSEGLGQVVGRGGKVVISWCFLSLEVSVEISVVSAASEQHMVHVALVSWVLLLARYKGQWLLLVLLDLSKQPLVFLNRAE